jgi:hypothetical protein
MGKYKRALPSRDHILTSNSAFGASREFARSYLFVPQLAASPIIVRMHPFIRRTHELNSWLTRQSALLRKAQDLINSDTLVEKGILDLEKVVQDYVQRANEGTIFQAVFGFENIVFNAQDVLAAAYVKQGRYDDALFLHRYIVETVQSMLRDRHRNKDTLKDVRDKDIDHLAKTAKFLVHFSRVMSAQGSPEPALQLLNEAIDLSGSWQLDMKHPELRQMIALATQSAH